MPRTSTFTIRFSGPQRDWLRDEADRLGIRVAELLRRIIDQHRIVVTVDPTGKREGQ